jgi:hypothetical protein
MKRMYFIGFRKFKKADEKVTFDIFKPKNIIEFFNIVDCDHEQLFYLLDKVKEKYTTCVLSFRLPNYWVDYYVSTNNKKKVSLSSITKV